MRVERFVGLLRVFGLVAGLLLIALSDFPERALQITAWLTLWLLSVSMVLIELWGRRTRWSAPALVHVGFAVDVLLITGYAVAFAHIQPNVSWAVAFTVVADATMRYGLLGSAVGYLMACGIFTLQAAVHRWATGEPTTVLGYAFALGTLFGVAGVLGLFTHLLARRVTEQRDQALALADALELLERGIAATSSDVRGALTIITGAAQTALHKRDRLDTAGVDALLADIEAQGRYLHELMTDVFPGGEGRLAGLAVAPRSGDVAETVRRAVEVAERHSRNHELRLDLPPLVCTLDHERLHQAVRNLVENAFRHTNPPGAVTVSLRRLGVTVEVRVTDEGKGIPPELWQRTEDTFARRRDAGGADGAERRLHGLGLYLVRQIVMSMGGVVELRTSSHGSDIAVRVPATAFDSS